MQRINRAKTLSRLIMGALVGAASVLSNPAYALEPQAISQETVDELLEVMADDSAAGRDNLSAGSEAVRSYIVTWLRTHNFTPGGDGGSYLQGFDEGQNILAIYHPPGTLGQPPEVLLSAHYDHLGYDCKERIEAQSPVCNGAADNAGGSTAILAALESLVDRAQAPVAVALWDAEEDGKVGSQYFALNPSLDMRGLKLLLNLDIVGSNLFTGGENLHFAVGAESGGAELIADTITAAEGTYLDIEIVSYVFGMGRSDQDSFVLNDYDVPFVFFGDSDGSIYHSNADELIYINRDKVAAVAETAAKLSLAAMERTEPYGWTDPFRDGLLAVYADAEVVLLAWTRLLEHRGENQLTAEQTRKLTSMARDLQRIVDNGPESFGNKESLRVIDIALYGLSVSRALPFVP